MADVSARLQIPDVLMAGPSQAARQTGSARPASTQVYNSSAPHSQPSHAGSQSARKRASHTVTSSQPQQPEQTGFRDVYSHPAAVAYAAAHPRRSIPKFGPYLLLQTLGEGEFGKVKLGLHCQWGEEVAVKLIRRGNIDTAVRMSKVEREIEVLRTIKHPNIVRLYDVIETDKYIGIILEYASGGELFDHILAHRYLKEKDACKLFAQLISGVWYIHQKKIVHRDLKLENLLLDRHRNVIITDFGFANRFEHRTDDLMQTSCGSPCYAAPELVISEGAYVGSAVDIWSCGVILYAMLAGYLPFDDDPANPDGDNINLLYRYIVNTPLTFPEYVSSEARDLLSLMLVPDPSRRANLEMIMAHSWLSPYAHLFKRSVQDLERMAMEQHQMKRLAYQRQMKQQTADASVDQSKLQRSQSARQDVPPIASVTHGRHGAHPPTSATSEYLYDTNADESIFSSPPPVPVVQPSSRRHVASAIVVPTTKPMDDDPFGPSPTIPVSQNLLSGDASMEVRASKSKEINGKSSRKNPPPVAIAPVKMSPERKKTERQRHTIQLEYGDDAQDPPLTPRVAASPRGKEAVRGQRHLDAQPVGNVPKDELDAGGATDTDTGYFPDDSSQASTNVTVAGAGAPNGVKPLPTPPSQVNGSIPQKFSASSPSVVPMDIVPTPPIVSITPTSPPRTDKMPPSSYEGEKPSLGRSVSGSIKSAASDSSRNKHRRGMSIDKIKGMFGSGSGSDTEGGSGLFSNGSIKRRRPSETSATAAMPRPMDTMPKRSTLQVAPTPSPDSKGSPASSDKGSEGKKSRRNTLTVMVEPISKQIRQRSKARTPSTEARLDKEAPRAVPSLSAGTQSTQESEAPVTPQYTGRPEVSPIITSIPASTSKASKVMQWFRYRSKSRGPSDAEQGDTSITDEYEKVPHPDREASVTPTAGSQRSRMFAFASSPDTVGHPQVPTVVTTPASDTVKAVPLASDASVPHTPHVNLTGRARGVLSNILSSPAAPRHGTFNKDAIRVHHGAVDHTMVTTGSPPDVIAHVTKVLLDMGLEVQQETDYKLRCVRAKRKKGAAGATGGITAISMVGSAGSNGVDKRGLPMPSQSSFSSTGGMLKGLLMRRQSSQVSNNSIPNSSYTYDEGPDASSASLAGPREKISVLPTPPAQEPIFGDRTVDQGDEVRFSVELTRIDRLDDTFTVDIRRLKGNLRSYKFLYDAIRERCDLRR